MDNSIKYNSIDQYHSMFPEKIQLLLDQMRETIRKAAPKAIEVISYNMPAFKQNKVLVYYAAYKNHIGFYPTGGPITFFEKELKPYKTSKGAIQFPIDKPIPVSLVKKIVQFRLKEDAQAVVKKK